MLQLQEREEGRERGWVRKQEADLVDFGRRPPTKQGTAPPPQPCTVRDGKDALCCQTRVTVHRAQLPGSQALH